MDFGTMPHTSFIPKKPLASTTPSLYKRKTVPLFTLISVVIFIISLAAAGGTFLYKEYLKQSLDDKKASLARNRAKFDPAKIEELKRLDVRIEHSKKLLSNHLAFTTFFDLLGDATLKNVQYKSLNLQTSAEGSIAIDIKGVAKNYASVALQSDEFAKTKGMQDVLISDLSLDQIGNVGFSVKANIDPDVFRYTSLLSGDPNTSDEPGASASATTAEVGIE